jgi:glyoxylase-like metal-dependent hydrolase (beta-lactamase superfamily II)
MTRFDLNGLELFSLEVFRASSDVRVRLGSRLTEEFPGLTLGDATRLRNVYPGVYAQPSDERDDRVLVHGNAFVVCRDDLTLLVDTGIGFPAPDAPYSFTLPDELEAAGIARDDVDMVFLTHHHADHIGWLCNDAVPNFPNARHFLNLPDLETLQATQPELFERQLQPLLEMGWLETVEGFQTIAPGVTTLPLPGHTLGQLGLWIDHDPQIILAADALHYPMQIHHPDWRSRGDANAEIAVQSRREVIAQAFSIGALLCATHLETPGVGRIVATDDTLSWQALEP